MVIFTNLRDHIPCHTEMFTREMTHLYDRLSQREKVVKETQCRPTPCFLPYYLRVERGKISTQKRKKYDDCTVSKKPFLF